jgi:hypothetical protein
MERRPSTCGRGGYEFRPEDLANIRTEITRQISGELHILLLDAVSPRALINSGAEFGVNECLSRAATGLDPTDRRHSIWFFFGGFAELLLGRVDAAVTLLEKSLERNPSYGSAQLFLMTALSLLERPDAATAAARLAASFRGQYPPNTPPTPSSSSGCRARHRQPIAPRSSPCSKKFAASASPPDTPPPPRVTPRHYSAGR